MAIGQRRPANVIHHELSRIPMHVSGFWSAMQRGRLLSIDGIGRRCLRQRNVRELFVRAALEPVAGRSRRSNATFSTGASSASRSRPGWRSSSSSRADVIRRTTTRRSATKLPLRSKGARTTSYDPRLAKCPRNRETPSKDRGAPLKFDCVYLYARERGPETKAAIRNWMPFYNHQRAYSALGGTPPALFYRQRNDINQPGQQVQRVAQITPDPVRRSGGGSNGPTAKRRVEAQVYPSSDIAVEGAAGPCKRHCSNRFTDCNGTDCDAAVNCP